MSISEMKKSMRIPMPYMFFFCLLFICFSIDFNYSHASTFLYLNNDHLTFRPLGFRTWIQPVFFSSFSQFHIVSYMIFLHVISARKLRLHVAISRGDK